MTSGIYTILSIVIFGILYCYTAAGVLIVIILSWFMAKKLIGFLSSKSIELYTDIYSFTLWNMGTKKLN